MDSKVFEGTKTYVVQHHMTCCDIKIKINFDHQLAKKAIEEMSAFWSGHPGDDAPFAEKLEFWLTLCASTCTLEVLKPFNNHRANTLQGVEGFCPLDGSYGIEITSIEEPDFSCESFEIQDWD